MTSTGLTGERWRTEHTLDASQPGAWVARVALLRFPQEASRAGQARPLEPVVQRPVQRLQEGLVESQAVEDLVAR